MSKTLENIESKILWLSTSMVHHANHVRENKTGLKVGGHQASCASISTIMTALWFEHLTADDRVSVKPHAGPVFHSIQYLLGNLGAEQMQTLRQFGGLQSYPSRTKDPVEVDYSTGSVGIGATAPIWGAIARRYVSKFDAPERFGRQYSLVGDAELDEGAIWEAVLDPQVKNLGEIVWIVDLNRQSLDRIVPEVTANKMELMFEAAGWQVIMVRFGELLEELFERPGGASLRERITKMSNEEYQRLLRCDATQLRERIPGAEESADAIRALLATLDDELLYRAIRDLGGHDFAALRKAFDAIDDTRPTVIIAYTIKGYHLPTEGHPQNHAALLTVEQYGEFAAAMNENTEEPWVGFEQGTAEAQLCETVKNRLRREEIVHKKITDVPKDFGRTPTTVSTTQAALGRTLLDLSRSAPEVAGRVVTLSPDVSSSTNLAGWINKVGVWATQTEINWFADDSDTLIKWEESPKGQHIPLGIAEGNLVGLLGELGATWSKWGEPLIPIGTLYDPFVERALEQWSFGIYGGGQSILVGTPSGVSLAGEGGAHQSIKTPSIGLQQAGCISYEPAFALDLEWILLDLIQNIGAPGGKSSYLRLSTRPVNQSLAAIPEDTVARERRRELTVAGGYTLKTHPKPDVQIVAVGAMVPEALAAAERLEQMGTHVAVTVVTSPDLLFKADRARGGLDDAPTWIIEQLFPAAEACPMVTVIDGHPHTLSFLPGINGVRSRHLGVTEFGQSGELDAVYKLHGIDQDSIVKAALNILR